jgi:hypothetical protein
MGVLGWTPATVMREAALADLRDAWQGHAAHEGLVLAPPVSAQFMAEMLKRFPDGVADGRRP